MFADTPMTNISETIVFQPKMLAPMKTARKAALKMLGQGLATFSAMRKIMSGHREKALIEFDSAFDMVLLFLFTYVEPAAEKIIQERVLTALPTESAPKTFKQATVVSTYLGIKTLSCRHVCPCYFVVVHSMCFR